MPKKATYNKRTIRLDKLNNAADNLSEKVGKLYKKIRYFGKRVIWLNSAATDNKSTDSSETLINSNPSSSYSIGSGNETWNPSDTNYSSRLREERRFRRGSKWLLRCIATAMWLAPVITPGLTVVIMAVPTIIGFWVIILTS